MYAHKYFLFLLGIPGEMGGAGEKGYPGDETYGIIMV